MNEMPTARRKKRVWLPPNFVRSMLAGHSALGLAFAALIYVVCASGVLAVFLHELYRWEQPDAPIVEGYASPQAVQTVLAATYEKAKADDAVHDIFIMGPGHVTPRFNANYHDHETGREGDWLADGSGALVTKTEAPWSQFVAELHMHLHLPRTWGLFLVGLTGVTLLSSLVSGVLAHPRIFKDAFALRWGGSKRLQHADLHNRLSVWGLPFHFVVSLSGALLGLSTVIIGVLALAAYDGDREKAFATILGPMPSEDETAAPLPDVAKMMEAVLAQHPNAKFANLNIGHVAHVGQVVQLGVRSPGHVAFSNSYFFDGNGKSLGDGGLETGGTGQQILGAIQPLHFGWFGGLPIKFAYGALGLALTIITQSGVAIWLARKREKGSPQPHWEKAWTALVWSQPLAFAATAVAALAGAEAWLLSVYLAVVAACGAWAYFAPRADSVGWVIRAVTVVALFAAPALHHLQWGARATDPMALWVNCAIVTAALLMAWRCFTTRAAALSGT